MNKELIPLHIFFITYTLSVILFFVNDRYRLPLAIPLIIYSGFTFYKLITNNFLKKFLIFVFLFLFSIPVFWELDISKLDFYKQSLYMENDSKILCEFKKKLDKATTLKEKSAILTELAFFYKKRKGYEQAYFLSKKAYELNPKNEVAKLLMKNLEKFLSY